MQFLFFLLLQLMLYVFITEIFNVHRFEMFGLPGCYVGLQSFMLKYYFRAVKLLLLAEKRLKSLRFLILWLLSRVWLLKVPLTLLFEVVWYLNVRVKKVSRSAGINDGLTMCHYTHFNLDSPHLWRQGGWYQYLPIIFRLVSTQCWACFLPWYFEFSMRYRCCQLLIRACLELDLNSY